MKQITNAMHPKPKKRLALLCGVVALSLAVIAGACSSDNSPTETATGDVPSSTASSNAPAAAAVPAEGAPPSTAAPSPTPTSTAAPSPTPASTGAVAEPASEVTSDETEVYLDQLEASGFEGVVAVRDGSDVTTWAFGVADREDDVLFDAETVFDIASITKQFTGAAILRLEMDGLLSVDDTLGEHVPGLPDNKAAITLHQLLTHTAGVPNNLGHDDEPIGRSDYLALFAETPLTSEPGDRYEYSNLGYSLLTAVIELATGGTYETYLQTALFEPAGMFDTGYVLPEWDGHTIAVGYDNLSGDRFGRPNEQPWDVDGPYWNLLGNGGLMSTAADMLRWDEALVEDQILDAAAKAKYFAPQVPQDPSGEAYYGYGWQIVPTPAGSPLITHSGGNHIFYADFLRLVDQDVAIFMATNSDQDAYGEIVFEVANHVLDGGLEAMFEDDSDSGTERATEPGTCLDTLPDIEMECGRLTVPADYDEPDGDTFSLPYVVLPALGDNPSAEPLVYLQGGPGDPTFASVALFAEWWPEFRQDRDMIFLEQRGTDPSGIFLGCGPNLFTLDDLQECHDQFVADGIDLSAFTTLNAAKDLAELRAELEIEQWHLLGASYGTTLAMVAMDNDPEGTASVILDAPTAPNVIIYNADVESLLDAFSKVFANCGADADCALRNPDLFDTHIANADSLYNEPWNIANTDLAEVFGPTLNHEFYLGESRSLVMGQPSFLPAFVTAIAERDANALLGLLEADNGNAGDGEGSSEQELEIEVPAFAPGLNHSIYCAEEAPFFDLDTNPIVTVDEWPAGTAELFLPPFDLVCEIWDVEPADPSDVDQINSAIPTLILAGEYDHTTPIRQGEIAAAGLSNSELIEVPSTGHTTLDNACARSIMVDFLQAPGGDRTCLADIAPIEWQ